MSDSSFPENVFTVSTKYTGSLRKKFSVFANFYECNLLHFYECNLLRKFVFVNINCIGKRQA